MKTLAAGLALLLGMAAFGCGSSDEGDDASADGGAPGGGTGGLGGGSGGTSATGGSTGTGGSSGSGSDDCPDAFAWYLNNILQVKAIPTPYDPGERTPNAYGLYDMMGNAIEWTQDCWHDTYAGAPTDGSAWEEADCEYWVVRGGCASTEAELIRVSARASLDITGYGGCSAGVRCVATSDSPSTAVEWVSIPGGTFTMGCSEGDTDCDDNELPAHSVQIAPFQMMAKEASQQDYFDVMDEWPGTEECDTCAASEVYYDLAQEFCVAIGGRLPTEAEWEYAARGGTNTRYSCGN